MADRSTLLAGVRILDLSTFLSGPFCTQLLGDLGAEVIKVEPPDGDQTRYLPPYFVGDDSVYYLSVNRNKRSIVIDLKTSKGRELLLDLAKKSDVLIENFRPGVLDRLWMTADKVLAQCPRLVWASISGFGQDGPYREYPAYDMIVQALSGGMSLTGERTGRPVRAGIPIGDLGAGLYSAVGLLAALLSRGSGDNGRKIDISMLDCQVAMLCYQAAYYLHSAVVPRPQGREHESIPTYNTFQTSDHDVVITANTEKMWASLCEVLDLSSVAQDPRFASNADRHRNRDALIPLLQRAFATKPAHHWVSALRAANVPVAVVNTLDLALTDPQVVHRRMVSRIVADDGRSIGVAGNPIKAEIGLIADRFPPRLGEHTRQVLRELLTLDDEVIESLLKQGVVAESRARDEDLAEPYRKPS
jgi:crotonobetainyl-CoA:carnitine CoA-transferase CaiB-like acyl-CoA transferase